MKRQIKPAPKYSNQYAPCPCGGGTVWYDNAGNPERDLCVCSPLVIKALGNNNAK